MTARVEVALQVAASPARAFDVFTRETALWWRPNALFGFTPREPGTVSFEGEAGGRFIETRGAAKVFEIGRITAWEPGRLLAFTWRQATFAEGQQTRVEVRFEPVGGRTRVTVIHEGWDSVPDEHVARHGMRGAYYLQRHGSWWRELLGGLKERLAEAAI